MPIQGRASNPRNTGSRGGLDADPTRAEATASGPHPQEPRDLCGRFLHSAPGPDLWGGFTRLRCCAPCLLPGLPGVPTARGPSTARLLEIAPEKLFFLQSFPERDNSSRGGPGPGAAGAAPRRRRTLVGATAGLCRAARRAPCPSRLLLRSALAARRKRCNPPRPGRGLDPAGARPGVCRARRPLAGRGNVQATEGPRTAERAAASVTVGGWGAGGGVSLVTSVSWLCLGIGSPRRVPAGRSGCTLTSSSPVRTCRLPRTRRLGPQRSRPLHSGRKCWSPRGSETRAWRGPRTARAASAAARPHPSAAERRGGRFL